jgi:hypothetical protein
MEAEEIGGGTQISAQRDEPRAQRTDGERHGARKGGVFNHGWRGFTRMNAEALRFPVGFKNGWKEGKGS